MPDPKDSMVPSRTGEVYFVDNGVANTVDFWLAANTSLDLGEKFINHLAASKIWNSTLHKHDPISSKVDFFNEFVSEGHHTSGGNDHLRLKSIESPQQGGENKILPAVGALDAKVDEAQLLPSNIEAKYVNDPC